MEWAGSLCEAFFSIILFISFSSSSVMIDSDATLWGGFKKFVAADCGLCAYCWLGWPRPSPAAVVIVVGFFLLSYYCYYDF